MSKIQKVAIVTGAGRGIGAAIAVRLASDGIAVALLDRDSDAVAAAADSVRRAGGNARAWQLDVTDADQVDGVVAEVAASMGAPNVLINNAGIIRDNLLFKMSAEEWDVVLDVHLRGPFLLSRAVQPYMVRGRWGRIVNLSSTSAVGNRGQANYATAKAGIQGFTKTLALELGKFGITVNAIAPGFIQTDMTAATAERLGLSFPDFIARSAAEIPVGRVGQPDDVANAASFFCAEAAGFVSGQVLYVAGGPIS